MAAAAAVPSGDTAPEDRGPSVGGGGPHMANLLKVWINHSFILIPYQ